MLFAVVGLLWPSLTASFMSASGSIRPRYPATQSTDTCLFDSQTIFEIELDMPPSNSGNKARLKFGSVLSVPSELVEVRYKLPFGLDVAPLKNLAVCTKDGAGGERAGDVLRYSSQWIMGLPSGEGLAATAAFTGIGPTWQCTMFDVMKAKNWEKVVEALTSNVDTRTDEVVLLFERPLESAPELQT
ncbi:hypothetical protein IV203_016669 [Nitzschia inconspicua]|uniref:Uncharacterized protein n=1 Tax=Nitzschia inconspicua TaxID=303405 RepID=A0A9K3KRK0_9STRA|nr:hypothetical protein IV203_016669 [Nitzschia inconspicua]